jgi:hypothetical protein
MNQQTSLTSLCGATQRFLARDEHRLLIDGREIPVVSNKTFDTFDPSTGAVLGRLAEGDEADINRAVRAARAAFEGPWSRWTPYERQALLYRVHDAIERNFEELAQIETMDMGAPISRTRATKAAVLKMILFFASQCGNIAGETLPNGLPGNVTTMSFKAPVGVVGASSLGMGAGRPMVAPGGRAGEWMHYRAQACRRRVSERASRRRASPRGRLAGWYCECCHGVRRNCWRRAGASSRC